MPVFSCGHRVPGRPVRPSFRDPRFALLLVGQSAGWVCSWAASLVLWGFAAYHFGASSETISLTALCWSGPPVILTAFTGGLTDRFGPRSMLIIGYTGNFYILKNSWGTDWGDQGYCYIPRNVLAASDPEFVAVLIQNPASQQGAAAP